MNAAQWFAVLAYIAAAIAVYIVLTDADH